MSDDKLSLLPEKTRVNVVRGWIRIKIEKKYNIRASNDIILLIITFANEQNCREVIHIALIGDGFVGKTSLSIQYAYNVFTHGEYQFNTEDYDFEKEIFVNDRQYRVVIANDIICEANSDYWCRFIERHKIFLLCYSVTNRESFRYVQLCYKKLIECKGDDKYWFILIGNKCDDKCNRQVTYYEGIELGNILKCQFFETSAKNDINVTKAFENIINQYIRDTSLDDSNESTE